MMDSTGSIKNFLRTSGYARSDKGADSRQQDYRPFVTISRQAGAGGHTVAAELVKTFSEQEDQELFGGWQMFDQNLGEMVADDPDIKVSLDSLLSEEYQTRTDDFFRQALRATTPQDMVMQRMLRLIRSLAEVGKVIIVGRAGAQATSGLGSSVAMRLVAPEPMRVKRMMELHNLDEKAALELTHNYDASRERLLKRLFDVTSDDELQYHVTWNTSACSPRAIALAVVEVLRERAAEFRKQQTG